MKALPLSAMPDLMQGVTSRHLLLLAAGILFYIGLIMVASASMGVAEAQYGNAFYFFTRHLIYLMLGLMVGAFALRVPIATWQRMSGVLLLTAFVLLMVVLIPGIGRRINGSMRWIGVGPLTLQPSEFAKFAVIAYMSGYLLRRQDEVRSSWFGFIKPMAVVGVAVLLLLLEPDFGASVVTVSAVLGMLFLAGTPVLQFAVLIVTVVVMGSLAVIFEPYRMKRLMAFTDPWADQFNSGYQLAQSLIAFGRGEWTGVGLGKSVQKLFYLPEAHTDFVFAVYAEEFGLVGVLFVIFLFWLVVRSAVRIGQQAELRNDVYAAYLAYGLSFLIGVQALVNIGVNMGLFPTKGLTLPLVSYGGTSLLIVFLMLGVLLRIDSENTAAPAKAAPARGGRS
ncbi:MAG TPA: putative lipid II flippase FtsW [Moraxellaceae bacterium]